MAREFAKNFYNSKIWRDTQKLYKQSKFGVCERCGRPHIEMIVHHKVYLTPENIIDPDIALNFDNLELLCIVCHNKEHFQKYSPVREDVVFNEQGELVKKNINNDTPL